MKDEDVLQMLQKAQEALQPICAENRPADCTVCALYHPNGCIASLLEERISRHLPAIPEENFALTFLTVNVDQALNKIHDFLCERACQYITCSQCYLKPLNGKCFAAQLQSLIEEIHKMKSM